MRQLEPFSYFADQASAIAGFGGGEVAPDPRYCFHTRYEPVRPGHAIYHVTIRGARACDGELTLRVHGFKPGAPGDIDLAGGGRLRLRDIEGERIELPIRFSAAPDAHYALYGYFSEPADLVAEAVDIAIEEVGGPAGRTGGNARGSGENGAARGYGPGNHLCTEEAPSLERPASQPCTEEQIASPQFAGLWSEISPCPRDPAWRWRLVMPLQVLDAAGLLAGGRRGLLLDAPDPTLSGILRRNGCIVEETSAAPRLGGAQGWTSFDQGDAVDDFAVGFERQAADPDDAMSLPERMMAGVAEGGLVVAMLAIDPREPRPVFRNRIQQIALRLIGRGHDVAQLCFPRRETLAWGPGGLGWFCFCATR